MVSVHHRIKDAHKRLPSKREVYKYSITTKCVSSLLMSPSFLMHPNHEPIIIIVK